MFVQCASSGADTVYGDVVAGAYRDLGVALDSYAGLPRSVVRAVRRTGHATLFMSSSHRSP